MSAALVCSHCGAPLTGAGGSSEVCRFCDAVNAAPPREVEVPVPVQIVHNVVHVAHAGGPAALERRCPHCKRLLVTVHVGPIALAGCGRCGGIWVDHTSGKALVESPQRVVVELAERAAAHAARNHKPRSPTPTCPECPAVLAEMKTHGVDLDVCDQHGTWFDAHELQSVMRRLLGEDGAPRRPSQPPTGTVTCVSCRTSIEASRANVGEDGPTCDACWRAHQRRLVERFEREHAVAAGQAGVLATAGFVVLGVAAALAGARRPS